MRNRERERERERERGREKEIEREGERGREKEGEEQLGVISAMIMYSCGQRIICQYYCKKLSKYLFLKIFFNEIVVIHFGYF